MESSIVNEFSDAETEYFDSLEYNQFESINLLISPVTGKSKKDWEEQLNRMNKGEQMMWDDSRYNKSKEGDIFIGCNNSRFLTFHKIQKILDPSNRLPSWAENIGQENRNVIYISPILTTMEWGEWLSLDGIKQARGTAPVKQGKIRILKSLSDKEILN